MDHHSYAPSAWQAMGCALKDIAGLTLDVETPEGQARAKQWFREVSVVDEADSMLDRLASSLAYHSERLENWPSVGKFSGPVRTAVASTEIPQAIWDDEATQGSATAVERPRPLAAAERVQVFAECFRSIAIFNDVLEWKPGSVSPADLGFKDIFLDQQEGHASPHVNILVFLEGAAHYLRKPSRPGLKGLLWTSHRSALTTICPYQKNAGHLTVAMSKSRGRIQYFYNDKVVLVNVFYGDKKTLHEVAKLDDAKQFSESLVQAFGGETDLALAAVESLKTTLGDPLNLGGAA